MEGLTSLERGHYGNVTQYPNSANTTSGAMIWVQGTDIVEWCNLGGWFAVDSVQYNETALTHLQLRFCYSCYGNVEGMGAIFWSIEDHSKPMGPIKPPKSLWAPPKNTLSTSGYYAYMESQQPGYNYTYTSSNSLINCSFNGNQTQVEVRGNQNWYGTFQGMLSLSQLEPGYYPGPLQYPNFNPAFGGFYWNTAPAGYNDQTTGWFVIDEIEYGQSIKLRFAEYLDNNQYPVYGAVYWNRDIVVTPSAPVYPPPPHLWRPVKDSLPSIGNYLYLETSNTTQYS